MRGRIERILDWSKVNGYREGENPARWTGHLDHLLPEHTKIRKVEHHPALPYAQVPAFMAELRTRSGTSVKCLEFNILTAARTEESIGAKWSEIDFGDNVWTVSFVIPRGDPATEQVFRIGYKFTWGSRVAVWTGSEEWPGNSRILEVVDVNGDGFVYRHESWADEATNKDASNLNPKSGGTITWNTDLHGCGPEARENTYDFKTCTCDSVIETPKGIGPINVACTQ